MDFGISKPQITRPKLSIYEYAGMLTQLAEYLKNVKDLDKYVEEPQINNIIDPCRVAFDLLRNGQIDIQIDRCGYESVLFSECERDLEIEAEIEKYLSLMERNRKEFFINKVFDIK